MNGRSREWMAAGGWVSAIAVATVAAAYSERFPVRWGLALVCVVVASLAAGIVAARWTILAVAPAPVVTAFVVVASAEITNPLGVLAVGAFLVPVASVCFAVGVPVGRRLGSPASRAWPLMLVALVPIPLARAERHATVRVDRSMPVQLDLRHGGYGGAHLGMTVSEVQDVLGPGRRTSKDDGSSPSFGSDGSFGPSSLQVTGDELSYPGPVIFDLDARGRVEVIEIGDRQAVLGSGIGVGDSITLATRALPSLRCREGALGSDEPTYFPECSARTATGIRVYLSAPYSERGAPIANIVLSHQTL